MHRYAWPFTQAGAPGHERRVRTTLRPIPISFHIGPLVVHTYGIGLAITFWFAYRYMERRLRRAGYESGWLVGAFVWIIVAAIVGARAQHVLANLSYYTANPGQILAVWHGGLSSFGGLLLGVPTGMIVFRRRYPQLRTVLALDLAAPVLGSSWALGRILGPQLMVCGGGCPPQGHPSTAWFAVQYANGAGGYTPRELPIPVFQAIDYMLVFAVLMLLERRWKDRPAGAVIATGAGLWGLARFFEEHFLLATGHLGSDLVQAAGILLFAAGAVTLAVQALRRRRGAVSVPEGSEANGPEEQNGSQAPVDAVAEGGRPGPGGPANA
jgi:phosphatidylglycerol:prolipoprotein diacylglycerol transferase